MKVKHATILLAGLSTLPVKRCVKQELPITNKIINETEVLVKKCPKILVIDNFHHNEIDIDSDFITDVPHGSVTSLIIEKGLPNADVIKENVMTTTVNDQANLVHNLNSLFRIILEKTKSGEIYDAINLSIGISTNYEILSRIAGIDINPENINSNKSIVKDNLKNSYWVEASSVRGIDKVLELMDEISKRGTKFYIAAGNTNDKKFNLLTLANNACVVGALNQENMPAKYSEKNSLINRWENGTFYVKKVNDGYNITGNNECDINKMYTSTFFHYQPFFSDHHGTSFATPRAIVRDFKN